MAESAKIHQYWYIFFFFTGFGIFIRNIQSAAITGRVYFEGQGACAQLCSIWITCIKGLHYNRATDGRELQ